MSLQMFFLLHSVVSLYTEISDITGSDDQGEYWSYVL